ncbi:MULTISPECIES: hypothetical protein [Bradyrhizobium]|uniref:hypothetical protein n=1 Tax=Bradyrhizobium TaxID=374 RepID=UPI001F3DBF7D|nr:MULTISPECIES: hypothetical protein [Bradyrhizobium]
MTGTTRIAKESPDILSFLNSAPSSFSSESFSTAVPPYALVDEPPLVEISRSSFENKLAEFYGEDIEHIAANPQRYSRSDVPKGSTHSGRCVLLPHEVWFGESAIFQLSAREQERRAPEEPKPEVAGVSCSSAKMIGANNFLGEMNSPQ